MADQKLRILIVGGEERNITKELRQLTDFMQIEQGKDLTSARMPKAQAIVVITRFVSRSAFDRARTLAKARKIPLVSAETGNYIVHELRRFRLLPEAQAGNGKDDKLEHADTKTETSPEPHKVSKSGLSDQEIISKYYDKAVEFAREYIPFGGKIDESELLDAMEAFVWPYRDECQEILLPELASRGPVLVNTVGTTWKRTGGGDGEYRAEDAFDDLEEAPKPKGKSALAKLIEKVTGLPAGPYKSLWAIVRETEKYTDFKNSKGGDISQTYRLKTVTEAKNQGLVYEKDDAWYVKRDEQVSLTPKQPKKKKGAEKVGKKKDETLPKKWVSLIDLKTEATKKKEKAAVDSGDPRAVRKRLGRIQLTGIQPGRLRRFKESLPDTIWNESAQKAIARRLKKLGIPNVELSSDYFEIEEWDTLAWEVLKLLPNEYTVPHFCEAKYEDMTLTCRDCVKKFVFTAAQQEGWYKRFGQLIPPSRCRDCGRAKS